MNNITAEAKYFPSTRFEHSGLFGITFLSAWKIVPIFSISLDYHSELGKGNINNPSTHNILKFVFYTMLIKFICQKFFNICRSMHSCDLTGTISPSTFWRAKSGPFYAPSINQEFLTTNLASNCNLFICMVIDTNRVLIAFPKTLYGTIANTLCIFWSYFKVFFASSALNDNALYPIVGRFIGAMILRRTFGVTKLLSFRPKWGQLYGLAAIQAIDSKPLGMAPAFTQALLPFQSCHFALWRTKFCNIISAWRDAKLFTANYADLVYGHLLSLKGAPHQQSGWCSGNAG